MARARSPPLAFLSQPPLPAFTLQQSPPPRGRPHDISFLTGNPTKESDAYEAIHSQYQKLLSHEREGMELERALWLSERQFYLEKIVNFELTIESLRQELEKAKASTSGGEPKDKGEDRDSEKDNVAIITSPPPPVTGPIPGAESPPPADVPIKPMEAESPEIEEARTPKQENGVEQFARPFSELDEKTTNLLYEQARRIVYPQRTWPEEKIALDEDGEGDDEDIKLILKKNTNFGYRANRF